MSKEFFDQRMAELLNFWNDCRKAHKETGTGSDNYLLVGMIIGGIFVLMLSAAMTGFMVRTLLTADSGLRVMVSCGFVALLVLISGTAFTAAAERTHELRLAQFSEKQQLYFNLTDSLFSLLDTYDISGHLNPEFLLVFLQQYRTELVTYGHQRVVHAVDQLLDQIMRADTTGSWQPCFFKALQSQTMEVINAIQQDLGQAPYQTSEDAFFRCIIRNDGPRHPVLRRYK